MGFVTLNLNSKMNAYLYTYYQGIIAVVKKSLYKVGGCFGCETVLLKFAGGAKCMISKLLHS